MIEDSCAIFIYLTYSDLVSNFAAIRTCENFGGNAPTEVKHPINSVPVEEKTTKLRTSKPHEIAHGNIVCTTRERYLYGLAVYS